VAARLRLGYGTKHVTLAQGVDAKRHRLALHVNEIMEALESASAPEDVSVHPEHGPLKRVSGMTGAGRAVHLLVQADQLPITLVDLDADAAGAAASGSGS
jgi:hypothetical protein